MKIFLPAILLLTSVLSVQAQNNLLYKKETSIGVLLHTRGAGLDFKMHKHQTAYTYHILGLNFHSLKHPKELRLPNRDNPDSRPYVFGKLNSFYALSGNYGIRHTLADRESDNNVKVNINFSAGPVLGLIKPVYYDVRLQNSDGPDEHLQVRFDPDNERHHQYTVGQAPFTKGLGELKINYGAVAKGSLSFDWGNEDTRYYSLETGVMMNAFPQEVPIFAYIENKRLFFNLFLTLSYGTRR